MEATAHAPDWLSACRRIVAEISAMLDAHPSTGARAVELSRGAGGDRTLVIDAAAERLIFDELERLHGAGHEFTVISEERGEAAYGAGELRVVVDPIDGSMNAKRGLWPYTVSIAVADGPSMADVSFGFVHDFGLGEEWSAERGAGARLNGRALSLAGGERRTPEGLLELVAIAFSLCQLAACRVDGVVTLRSARSVDAAAAQLIVRESGGYVAFTAGIDPLGFALDLAARSPIVAAGTPVALAELAGLQTEPDGLRSSGR